MAAAGLVFSASVGVQQTRSEHQDAVGFVLNAVDEACLGPRVSAKDLLPLLMHEVPVTVTAVTAQTALALAALHSVLIVLCIHAGAGADRPHEVHRPRSTVGRGDSPLIRATLLRVLASRSRRGDPINSVWGDPQQNRQLVGAGHAHSVAEIGC